MQFSQRPSVSRRGTAAVIDGDRVLLTPLRHVVVPPPMAAVTARVSAPVEHLAFCDAGHAEVGITVVLPTSVLALGPASD